MPLLFMNIPLPIVVSVLHRCSVLRVFSVGLLVCGGALSLRAAPVLDARAQCGAAVVPDANIIYFNDSKAVKASGFYRAAQERAAQAPPEATAARKAAEAKHEAMKPVLDLMKKDLSLAVGTCALRQFDPAGKPDMKRTPFVVALAFDRALTVEDVTKTINKAGKPPGSVTEHAGYSVISDPNPKPDAPTIAIALAPAGERATTVFFGPIESVHAALDRLRSGQVASLTDLPARAAASIEPGAQSWLYFAPPADAMASWSKMAPRPPTSGGASNTAVTAARDALSGLNSFGISMSTTETMKLRVQGGFATVADAEAVRTFLENMVIPGARIALANKLEKMPGAIERLRAETSGPSTTLSTTVDAADIGLVPPEALGFLGY